MYYRLVQAMKRRFIFELRRYFASHPQFRDKLVENIQGKYSFKQRPQMGIVIKGGSGQPVQMSADNFLGTIRSYVMQTRVKDKPGLSVEWVRENSYAIRENGGRFPTPPGVYYIDITEHDPHTMEGEFFVDPLLDVRDERPMMVSPTEGVLEREPLARTLRLYLLPGGQSLREGVDYDIDPVEPQRFHLRVPLEENQEISADYRYVGDSTGPHKFRESRANVTAIPGVVIAFGRRVEKGDQLAVAVYDRRRNAYLAFGGKWSLPFEFEIFARDHETQMEISDQTAVYLWGILRSRLSTEGIEIRETSIDGEGEEIYDEGAGDYFYNANLSCVVETDWEIHVPIHFGIRSYAVAFDDTLALNLFNRGPDPTHGVSNVEPYRDPFFSGRNSTYEVIR